MSRVAALICDAQGRRSWAQMVPTEVIPAGVEHAVWTHDDGVLVLYSPPKGMKWSTLQGKLSNGDAVCNYSGVL